MMTITLKGTSLGLESKGAIEEMGSMARQIEEMRLELHEMEINVTTQKQHHIFKQKDIYREIKKPRNNPGVTSISMRRQALDDGDKTPEAVSTLPNRGTPFQRDSIGSATKGREVEMLNEYGEDETLEGEQKKEARNEVTQVMVNGDDQLKLTRH